MKQTAVDYLFQELWQAPKDKFTWQHYLEKAKEMEKEQILDAYHQSKIDTHFEKEIDGKIYYKQTYEQ